MVFLQGTLVTLGRADGFRALGSLGFRVRRVSGFIGFRIGSRAMLLIVVASVGDLQGCTNTLN